MYRARHTLQTSAESTFRVAQTVDSTTSQGEEGNAHSMNQADIDKITSLNGHPGMLTKQQEAALETFRGLVTDAKLYTPASGDGESKPSHTDATLLYVPSSLTSHAYALLMTD